MFLEIFGGIEEKIRTDGMIVFGVVGLDIMYFVVIL